jgi:hypothetical protein
LLKKGGVTAAGPLPAFTGFPIKPLKAPQPFYAKVSGGVWIFDKTNVLGQPSWVDGG